MNKNEIIETANSLVAPGKGILAADWSTGTATKQFEKNGIEPSEENRRIYRQMLFTTGGIEEFISGVILYDETIHQKTDDGKPIPQLLSEKGITPGIKVDKGAKDMANFSGEKVTEGLDGLRDRLREYHELGARFTKWRAAIAIGDGIPTDTCIGSNAEALARFAALTQEANMVPIVEPEDLMEGTHNLQRNEEVTRKVLAAVFAALEKHKVILEGTILKTNYVHSGKESDDQMDYREVAEETFRTLERVVPPALPGVVFLSGGDNPEESTAHMNEIARLASQKPDLAWQLSFSYARALQYPAIGVWAGRSENFEAAQKAFYKRVKLTGLARQGKYDPSMENNDD